MLNQREIDVLNILCAAKAPMTSSEIVSHKKGLTQSTVIAVLRRLATDNLVLVDGLTHSGKVLSRTYIPGANAKAAILDYYKTLFSDTKNIVSAADLKAAIDEIY